MKEMRELKREKVEEKEESMSLYSQSVPQSMSPITL